MFGHLESNLLERTGVTAVTESISLVAKTHPDRLAIITDSRSLTYSELEYRTNQIARFLVGRGVTHSSLVGFVLPRSVDTVLLIVSILKAGGAYVPMASESPISRVQDCYETAEPTLAILPDEDCARWQLPCECLSLRFVLEESANLPADPLNDIKIDPKSAAYIIFTSGTTGRPKGVPIRHESLTNFAVGDLEACMKVESEDRVLQCYSPASDGHIEEIWPTFLAGAALVVASDEEVHAGDALARLMNRHQVTIVSCAPTLLSMVSEDVPSLRRILFGAENLPQSLVARWWREDREIINTYGPTEATVGATFGYCLPGKPITIGKPLPGYSCYILNEEGEEAGEGELTITGVGVASGYLGDPSASDAKFVPNPFSNGELDRVMYRTGDRASRDVNGNLVWLGRLDAQVKIRGHRIELTEIEGNMLADPAVQAAAAMVRQEEGEEATLVALVVLRNEAAFELVGFLDGLKQSLPGYMVPQSIEIVDRIPVLPSGKIDRSACLRLKGKPVRIEREIVPPASEAEELVLKVWKEVFRQEEISVDDDFFNDLGGYSLLASKFVSLLRNEYGYKGLSVIDIYENRTIRSFAPLLASQTKRDAEEQAAEPFKPVPKWRYRFATAIQGISICFFCAFQAFFWLSPIIGAIYLSNNGFSDTSSLFLGLAIHTASIPLLMALVLATKWIVVGRFREGVYPMWGSMFLRWWFVNRMFAECPIAYLTGTPFAAHFLRLLGAKVGKNVTLDAIEMDCFDLIEIGDDAIIEHSAWIMPASVVNGELVMQKIKIGNGCVMSPRSGLASGASMEDGAVLRDLTCVQEGVAVPQGEEWIGVPAKKAATPRYPAYDPTKRPPVARSFGFGLLQVLLILTVSFMDVLPFQIIGFTLYNLTEEPWMYLLLEPVFAVGLVLLGCIEACSIKWIVGGKTRAGTYPYPGFVWLRKWFADKHLQDMSTILMPIYDSLFARPWCRALGMKCGARCEIALPINITYDLVEVGEESFIASNVNMGTPLRRNNEIVFERIKLGRRVFIGNDSTLTQNLEVPSEFLLGVLSACPDTDTLGKDSGQAWLGTPAFRMPKRQMGASFQVNQTYRPTRRMYAERLMYEGLRIILPSLFALMIFAIVIEGFVLVWNEFSLTAAILMLGPVYLIGLLAAAGLLWIAKRLLVGRYAPNIQPLWSRFVYRLETFSALLHSVGVPLLIIPIIGTPYLTAFMRFMGAKIGKRVFINSYDWTETDLIHIGDDTAINWNAPLQGHLFEDRIMKVGAVHIGERVSLGVYSIVLCDAVVKDDVRIGHLSLVMKGETIPSNSYWIGSPSQEAVVRK